MARIEIEKQLQELGFKIILLTFPEDEELIQKRLADRLRLYPNYKRIAKTPNFYIEQQRLYKKYLAASPLDHLVLEADRFPNQSIVDQIKDWIG